MTWPAHNLSDGQPVIFTGGTFPTGITSGTVYYMVNVTTNTFNISLTQGGTLVDLTLGTDVPPHTANTGVANSYYAQATPGASGLLWKFNHLTAVAMMLPNIPTTNPADGAKTLYSNSGVITLGT